MERDRIGPLEERAELDQLDAVVGGLLGRHERIGAEHGHLHRPGTGGDRLADLAKADDPQGPAAELDAGELAPLPFAAPERRVGGGDPAGDRVEEGERVLGRGDRVAGRRVDDDDPGPGRRIEVDVVHADPGAADDDEPATGRDELGVDLDLAPDDERVVVGQDRRVAGPVEARALVDLMVRAEELDALRCERFGDEDPHASTGASAPVDSSAARWAAATAVPISTGRPSSSEASSRTPIASRISPSVTDPRWPTRKICPVELALPAGQDDAARLDRPVEGLPVEVPSGTRAAVTVREAKRWSANSSKPSAWRPARVAAAQASWRAKIPAAVSRLHELEALVDLVDDGDRRRPRGLALGVRRRDGPGGRGRSAASSPSPSPPRPARMPRPWPGPGRSSTPSATRSRRRRCPRRPSRTAPPRGPTRCRPG